MMRKSIIAGLMSATAMTAPVFAHESGANVLLQETQDGIVSYQAAYFETFNALNAWDMVQRVPGFSVDNGDDVRGFGGAAGPSSANAVGRTSIP